MINRVTLALPQMVGAICLLSAGMLVPQKAFTQQPVDLLYYDTEDDFIDLNVSFTNAYSGEAVAISGSYYALDQEFVGGQSSNDRLVSFFDDAIFLSSSSLPSEIGFSRLTPNFKDIETFDLAGGNNLLHFAAERLAYGRMIVFSGNGVDVIWTNEGDDLVYSGGNADVVNTGPGADRLFAGEGPDEIRGGLGRDQLFGEAGADTLYFSVDDTWSNLSVEKTTAFASWNVGSPDAPMDGARVIVETYNQSHDYLDGGEGSNDFIVMTDGNDALFLQDYQSPFALNALASPRIKNIETIDAAGGDDIINLTSRDLAYGDVVLLGADGDDILWSSSGNDLLYGEADNDHLDGGAGNDGLYGGPGSDVLYSGAGTDQLYGNEGDDLLYGGQGVDLFVGGAGADTVIYEAYDPLLDGIVGFTEGPGGDALDVSALLSYDPAADNHSDFVRLVSNSSIGGTDIEVSLAGDGTGFSAIANFDNGIISSVEQLINAGNLILHSVDALIPGDYDGDGQVSESDYTAWKLAYGLDGASLADGNGDGRVDAADYTVWRDAFASANATPINVAPINVASQEAISTVPEPSAALYALLLGLLLGTNREVLRPRFAYMSGRTCNYRNEQVGVSSIV